MQNKVQAMDHSIANQRIAELPPAGKIQHKLKLLCDGYTRDLMQSNITKNITHLFARYLYSKECDVFSIEIYQHHPTKLPLEIQSDSFVSKLLDKGDIDKYEIKYIQGGLKMNHIELKPDIESGRFKTSYLRKSKIYHHNFLSFTGGNDDNRNFRYGAYVAVKVSAIDKAGDIFCESQWNEFQIGINYKGQWHLQKNILIITV